MEVKEIKVVFRDPNKKSLVKTFEKELTTDLNELTIDFGLQGERVWKIIITRR